MSDENSLKLKLFGPVAESAGETLQSVWETVFGNMSIYSKKKQLIREQNFKEFKESVEKRVIEIPPDAVKEPKLSILGPTLESSKYYFEEKPIREMFSALASASMDKRKEKNLHPSYPEIIKQMSPLDAKNFELFHAQLPVAEYYQKKNNQDIQRTVLTNVFVANKEETNLKLQSMSISSLVRLGLIETDYISSLLSDKYYVDFLTTEYFLELSKRSKPRWIAGVRFGRARPTPLGRAFRSVCLE